MHSRRDRYATWLVRGSSAFVVEGMQFHNVCGNAVCWGADLIEDVCVHANGVY